MTKAQKFKKALARIFDDNLRTKQWENWVDYAIIGLIVISTISVFLTTFELPPKWVRVIHIVDIFTIVVFTIEVSLRIWAADEISPRFQGIKGRIRYCFTFYGFIDFISTYSFYFSLFLSLPYAILKAVRVLRLLRVFRYMHSFKLLARAIQAKSKEMLISLQFLVIVTLLLSFILFFYEHDAQPDVYSNGFTAVVWAFAQYIGDPGNFAETPPITFIGKIIACIVGLLGIALFAIPAGLVGAGFSEVIDDDNKRMKDEANVKKLQLVFETRLDRLTGFQIVPQYLSMSDIQARMGMKVNEIIDAIEVSKEFRLINLASTQTIDEHPQDKLAVEHFYVNRPYGCCIDRGSKVTIVSPSSLADACIGNFSYYIALIGGFNYISREIGTLRPYKSYYSFEDRDKHEPNLPLYMEDLERLTSVPNSWTLTPLASSGANEPAYPTVFHFSAGGPRGDEGFGGENLFVKDIDAYKEFFLDLSNELETKFQLTSDHQRYHNLTSPRLFMRKYSEGRGSKNNIVLRVAWSVCLWDSKRIAIAKTIADALNRHFEKDQEKKYPAILKTKKSGYE